jgi:hypothetical protein
MNIFSFNQVRNVSYTEKSNVFCFSTFAKSPYGSRINLREEMSATECFDHVLLDQEWLCVYQNAESGEPPLRMKRAAHMPALSLAKREFRSTSSPSHNLADTLLRDTKGLSKTDSCFTRCLSCDDFGVAIRFFGCMVSLWHLREWGVIQHLHDVKRRQPNIEASCGFDPYGAFGAGHSPV